MEEEALVPGKAVPGPNSRARRVTLLLLESDGGLRLVGTVPGVAVGVESAGASAEQSLSNSDGLVDITRLPPPYHCNHS